MSCQAVRLVTRHVSSTQAAQWRAKGLARPADVTALADGPAGGYSPTQLAKAYGLDADGATTQTVAIVDAFDDPTALFDLNTFNDQYGLPHETASSFQKVNQEGLDSPLPAADPGWAGEITLDVQAVRGLCHNCKILLVEADSDSNSDIATAVDQAVTMGATIVSNSYGGFESGPADPAYDHPGVAMLASSGDDGWYGWDVINELSFSPNLPLSPASYNSVVAVGGTSLYLNPDGTRAGEEVWNTNGPADVWGLNFGIAFGASGSGCSTLYNAQLWQKQVAGYGTLGCGNTRSSVDIAADADPFTGLDIFQTYPNASGVWETVGGTSLSSPLVAAMWALAGGPGGVTNPALSLYGHFNRAPSRFTYDVTVGGTGLCHTATLTACLLAAGGINPNSLGLGDLDCGWSTTNLLDSTPLTNRFQCYAQPGYDGVSGVGTPIGVNVFKAMGPTAVITTSGTVTHGVPHSFSGANSKDPFPGGAITSYKWNWGDGHTSTGKTVSHTYAAKGSFTITLTVTDNYGRKGARNLTITVK
jgi:subtilase family serine protease